MIPARLSWEDLLHPLYQKYKNHITWGDQDLLNIIFHDNPGALGSTAPRAATKKLHVQMFPEGLPGGANGVCASPPECLFIFPCQWNYRPDHCMYGSNCRGAEKDGVSILHGNRGVYHDDKQPAFKVVYDAIREVSSRRSRGRVRDGSGTGPGPPHPI